MPITDQFWQYAKEAMLRPATGYYLRESRDTCGLDHTVFQRSRFRR